VTIDSNDCKPRFSNHNIARLAQPGIILNCVRPARPDTAGDSFGAAYIIGWFDDIEEMNRVCDEQKAKTKIVIEDGKFRLECDCE
jgi:hypothetical protein